MIVSLSEPHQLSYWFLFTLRHLHIFHSEFITNRFQLKNLASEIVAKCLPLDRVSICRVIAEGSSLVPFSGWPITATCVDSASFADTRKRTGHGIVLRPMMGAVSHH